MPPSHAMLPPSITSDTRSRFNGNAAFYDFQATNRQRIFLHRNIDAALRANPSAVGAVRRHNRIPASEARPASARPPRQRHERGALITGIYDRLNEKLSPAIRHESVLKLEVKALKRRPANRVRDDESMVSNETANEIEENKDSVMKIRSRCELTIFEKLDPVHAKMRDKRIIFMSNEYCTINMYSDTTSTIEMDYPFYVKASKLFVLSSNVIGKRFGLANNYIAQIHLSCVEPDKPWPPMMDSSKLAEPTAAKLFALLNCLPREPSAENHQEVLVVADPVNLPSKAERAWMTIELDCKWSDPPHPSAQIKPRLKRSQCDDGTGLLDPLKTLTCFYFVSPPSRGNDNGEAQLLGQRAFTTPGFCCVFCNGRTFPNAVWLEFHFLTAHELFSLRVTARKPTNGTTVAGLAYDQFIEVFVDLPKEIHVQRITDKTPDFREMQWRKPRRPWELKKIFAGDWSWLNQRAQKIGGRPVQREPVFSPSIPPAPILTAPEFSLTNVPKIKPKRRRTYTAPPPLSGVEGLVYMRQETKRWVLPGEDLSDSDDDVSETWLYDAHEETLEDFSDVATAEKQFMKLWDRHMATERVGAYCHLGQSVVRFVEAHRKLLKTSALFVEFYKWLNTWLLYRGLDSRVVEVAMREVKGYWSSFGKTRAGIGEVEGLFRDFKIDNEDVEMDGYGEGEERKVGLNTMAIVRPDMKWGDRSACFCGKGWERRGMVRCVADECVKRWFHRRCVGHRGYGNFRCEMCFKEEEVL